MKRNIINTSVTDEAKAIYDSLPSHGKGRYISTAIVEKYEHDTGTGIQVQVDDLRMRVEKLEGRGRVSELFTLW